MNNEESEIESMVNKETKAWNEKDAETLVSLFHEDMVWPWPINEQSHDPLKWEISQGRFNYKRWKDKWQQLFDNYDLKHNERAIKKIMISDERDGAFAVVDIDTIWIGKTEKDEIRWHGRVCKVYSKCSNGWKITMHTGVLTYPS